MTIDPHLPPGNGGNGNGCQPGAAPGPSSIDVRPNMGTPDVVAVATGTDVQLVGNAVVRVWRKDCSFVDHACSSIVWTLYYQPPGSGFINATSLLVGGPQSNPNSFTAGDPGLYRIVLGCPELALHGTTVAARDINVGPTWRLDSLTTTVWVDNSFAGMTRKRNVEFHAVLVEAPNLQQWLVQVDPIVVSTITVTQQSAGGTFDSASGQLILQDFMGNISGQLGGNQVSGTIDITLSTDGTITPPDGSGSISGTRRGSDGSVTLVGDAPIDGPPGTTHAWIEVSGTLTAV